MQEVRLSPAPKIKVITDAGEYVLRKPKMRESIEFDKRLADKDSGGELEVVMDFISSLGIPKHALEELDADQMRSLVDALVPKKND